ncbi:MAG: hypothetical protein H6Q71_1762, partial [Firmicutes bacterium]|nr:hypothetical protein [Bacillota bacterium]
KKTTAKNIYAYKKRITAGGLWVIILLGICIRALITLLNTKRIVNRSPGEMLSVLVKIGIAAIEIEENVVYNTSAITTNIGCIIL